MLEAVKNFVENKLDVLSFDSHIVSDIKDMYITDMKKYVKNNSESIKIERVYKNILSILRDILCIIVSSMISYFLSSSIFVPFSLLFLSLLSSVRIKDHQVIIRLLLAHSLVGHILHLMKDIKNHIVMK